MSWSRGFSGTPAAVAKAAHEAQQEIEASLPEFEKADVGHAIDAADQALEGFPSDCEVSLSLSGHGWREATGAGGGSLSISVSYKLEAKPQE